jgi:hypothetical protein
LVVNLAGLRLSICMDRLVRSVNTKVLKNITFT